MTDDNENLLRQLIAGETSAGNEILARAWTDNTPTLLVAAALLADEHRGLLARAGKHAVTTRDRQLVAIASAHFTDDEDRLEALVRDHLADHPDSILAAWVAAQHSRSTLPIPA